MTTFFSKWVDGYYLIPTLISTEGLEFIWTVLRK